MSTYHLEIKSGAKGAAKDHSRYITRRGKHEGHDDLIFTAYGNLPTWAGNNPSTYWHAADRYERINGAAYREYIAAIPNELELAGQIKFVETIVEGLIGSKPYEYAIHAPDASLGDVKNVHAHIMFSDRLPDGIIRTPQREFSRYNARHPKRGGCKKDSGGKTRLQLRDDVIAKREFVACTANQMLSDIGSSARVDHRSHRARGLGEPTERHLGAARINRMSAEAKAAYVSHRHPTSTL